MLGNQIIQIQNDREIPINQRQRLVEASKLTRVAFVSDEVALGEQISMGGEKVFDDSSREIGTTVVVDDQCLWPLGLLGHAFNSLVDEICVIVIANNRRN